MPISKFPTSQSELIKCARADSTQAEFARSLGVDRSCLSRYESEALGAPTSVINTCLRIVALRATEFDGNSSGLQRSLKLARALITELETASTSIELPTEHDKSKQPIDL